MLQANKPNKPNQPKSSQNQPTNQPQSSNQNMIEDNILNSLNSVKNFSDYPIRELVTHSEEFGMYLKSQKLETNQIRKFLDAINRLKVKVTQKGEKETEETIFKLIEPEIVLLKPKLAYAAAREQAAKPLNKVMAKVIDKVHSLADFERLVQFIESIIAYHKAAGGK